MNLSCHNGEELMMMMPCDFFKSNDPQKHSTVCYGAPLKFNAFKL